MQMANLSHVVYRTNCTYRPVPALRFRALSRTCKRLFCLLSCTALMLWWW